MIGFYTQIYFASNVIEKLPLGSSQVIKLYPDAFRLGVLGANVFEGLGNIKSEMDCLHGYDLFASTAEYILSSGSKCQLSYMLGMICHYLLDSRLNPYIYYLAENGVKHYFDDGISVLEPKQIGASIDYYVRCAYMLSRMEETKEFMPRDFVVDDIVSLYTNSINPNCLGYVVEESELKRCFKNYSFVDPIPTDMLTNDFMNTNHNSWEQIRNERLVTSVSIEQLMRKIEPIALKMIKDYMGSARSGLPLTRKAFIINANGVKIG